MDYGKDFYAAVTWNDVPDGRRIAIGWMNNWNYAGAIPTDPWRSAMSVPRELALQHHRRAAHSSCSGPSASSARCAVDAPSRSTTATIPQGTTTLPVRGKALEIKTDLRIGSAKQAGLKVRTGNGEETVIGYDAQTDELYVDRTRSGRVGLQPRLPRRPARPARRPPREGPPAHPRRLVLGRGLRRRRPAGSSPTRSSPAPTSDGVELFADGGSATLDSLKVRHLRSSWTTGHHNG